MFKFKKQKKPIKKELAPEMNGFLKSMDYVARVQDESEIIKKYIASDDFKTAAREFCFNNQSKTLSEHFAAMRFVFIDSNGARYYTFNAEEDIPLLRYEVIQIIIQEINNRISNVDLDAFLEQQDDTLFGEQIKKPAKKLEVIGHLNFAMKHRRKLLYEPHLLFRLACALYIREDQNPTIWEQDLENEKLIQLKKDAARGLRDFFYNAGLRKYLPEWWASTNDLKLQLEIDNQEQQVMEFQNFLATLKTS